MILANMTFYYQVYKLELVVEVTLVAAKTSTQYLEQQSFTLKKTDTLLADSMLQFPLTQQYLSQNVSNQQNFGITRKSTKNPCILYLAGKILIFRLFLQFLEGLTSW